MALNLQAGEIIVQISVSSVVNLGTITDRFVVLTNLGRIFKKNALDNETPWEQIATP